ncbi:unnamed protein product [Nesidiocoris tenuis]|uniref:Uncharacterized protein n=1 Tax=Nesidiocoris tenuis TaxID=355587 RepID=A0A6H5G5W1_9HEMI|nr:unnamed protein product [Nesidiocoris tenuis]CAA9999572.1 unnamed protein product [Nesidiocoris tenuis]
MPHKLPDRRFGDVDNRSEAIDWLDALAQANFKSFDQLAIDDRISPSDYLQVGNIFEERGRLGVAVAPGSWKSPDEQFQDQLEFRSASLSTKYCVSRKAHQTSRRFSQGGLRMSATL